MVVSFSARRISPMKLKSGPRFVFPVLAVMKAPTPCRFRMNPSSSRSARARRTVMREIENCRQSASCVGSSSSAR